MACTNPIKGWRSREKNTKTGRRSIVFNSHHGYLDQEVLIPCGQCCGCRLDYSRQWAVRCVHEAQMHEKNCFITLTFNDENYPSDHSIHKEDLQKFFKRLRKNEDIQFRYFASGEYGSKNSRPHYHSIIFGYDFPDRKAYASTKNKDLLYTSEILKNSWPYGFHTIGDMSFQSAAYVSRYVMKKRKGKPEQVDKYGKSNEEYYMLTDPETGEIYSVEPEFCLMSRGSGQNTDNPLFKYGIGYSWLMKYMKDTDKDFITINGNKIGLPKYYDNIIAKNDDIGMQKRKNKRSKLIKEEDQTTERLLARNKVIESKAKLLIRNLEEN